VLPLNLLQPASIFWKARAGLALRVNEPKDGSQAISISRLDSHGFKTKFIQVLRGFTLACVVSNKRVPWRFEFMYGSVQLSVGLLMVIDMSPALKIFQMFNVFAMRS
jgi:hypothetical protein